MNAIHISNKEMKLEAEQAFLLAQYDLETELGEYTLSLNTLDRAAHVNADLEREHQRNIFIAKGLSIETINAAHSHLFENIIS